MSAITEPVPTEAPSPAELWLLSASIRPERPSTEIAAGFGARAPRTVVAPPAGAAAEVASELGAAWHVRVIAAEGLADVPPGEPDVAVARRAWEALERVRTGAEGESLLVVTSYDVLRVLVARALGAPLERSHALCVDAGRFVLLRQGPLGLDLRHANVVGPDAEEGAALPGAQAGKARA